GAVVRNIEAAMSRWVVGVPQSRRTIAQYRRRLLSDGELAEIRKNFDLAWVQDFENRSIQSRWACIHSDLHGFNILVSAQSAIVLIDYAEVGEGPVSLDPVTLELSILFHPEFTATNADWPTLEQAKAWGNLAIYLDNCPYQEFIRECRQWAERVA